MTQDPPSLFEVDDAPRPLADRLRPRMLGDVVGQDHLLSDDAPIGRMVAACPLRHVAGALEYDHAIAHRQAGAVERDGDRGLGHPHTSAPNRTSAPATTSAGSAPGGDSAVGPSARPAVQPTSELAAVAMRWARSSGRLHMGQ